MPVPKLPTLALPLTESDDSVPVLVIFGCAAVVNEPPNVVANTPAVPILPTFALPLTDNDVSVPVLVIFG